jgi:hypothetical protein
MASEPRTFVVASPHMRGEDINEFQRDLNARYEAWGINKRIAEDGDYGMQTRTAAREVCTGLGVAVPRNGITPALRIKIRHPKTERTAAEVTRSKGAAAKAFLAKLRKEHKSVGQVVVAAGANAAGRPIQKPVLDFVGRMSKRLGKPITITTGTNHNKFTVNGAISDHFTGMAVDIGMIANGGTDDSPVGDHIMTAALIEAGVAPKAAAASARSGGLFNEFPPGFRVQCIWKTIIGGTHPNHVHVGLREA